MTRDYGRLVGASAGSALLAVAAKLSAVVTIANLQGTTVRVGLARGWIPYVDVPADRASFAELVTLSTAAMAVVAALHLLPVALRGRAAPDLARGRLVGVAIAAETFSLEYARHLLDGPVLTWPAAALTLGALGVGIAAGLAAVARSWRLDPPGASAPFRASEVSKPEAAAPRGPVVPTAMLSLPPDPFTWDRREPATGLDGDGARATAQAD